MPPKIDIGATPAQMERTCAETARQLDTIERQITARAERMVVTTRTKARQFGRGTSTWTLPDERLFRETFAGLRFQRRAEIDASTRKLVRQSAAIDAFKRRHRINEPPPQSGTAQLPVDKVAIRCHDYPTKDGGHQAATKMVGNDKGGKRWFCWY
jgi:hypothetical protein